MRFFVLPILAVLPISCKSSVLPKESVARLNSSALYDPPTVTLIDGRQYQFKEGTIEGRGQKFHSHYSYLRAITIGR